MAITYGMSVKEFWEDNPDLFWAYRFSYYEKIRVEREISNQNAWLQGAYFYEAISVALANSFGKAKAKYPLEPYGTKKESKEDLQNVLVTKIKNRVNDIQNKFKKENSITIREKGGEEINESNIRNTDKDSSRTSQ